MGIDRETALKQAEKLLRQGRLDGAIAEYVRLVEDQPRDWNATNALGDLYLRAGDAERAVAQYTRIADYLFAEGFLPKAAALYKKALKAMPAHEHTLLQLGEIAARQGLLGDAKGYFSQLAGLRRGRGDERGAAACLIRLGRLDETDPDALIAAVRAAVQVGDTAQAAAMLKNAGAALRRQQRRPEALAGYVEAARLFLDAETAGDDPDLLLTLARLELRDEGRDMRPTLLRILTVAPDRQPDVMALCEELAASGRREQAYGCVEALTDVQLLEGKTDRAIVTLQRFLRHGPYVPALIRLVELCVDAGCDAPMRAAQAALADAYLDTGYAAEARVIAEDLLAADPASQAHAQRLRLALETLGVEDPDAAMAAFLPAEAGSHMDDGGSQPTDGGSHKTMEAPVASGFSRTAADHTTPEAPVASSFSRTAADIEIIELDLSDALAALLQPDPPAPAAPPLEAVFEGMRARVAQDPQTAGAAELVQRATAHLREGRVEQAAGELQAAARVPMFRFVASAQLGRLCLERGELQQAVDWFERAAEAPPPTPDEGFALLYDLAGALEQLGESARALAVLIELDADAGGYRDVRTRVDELSRSLSA